MASSAPAQHVKRALACISPGKSAILKHSDPIVWRAQIRRAAIHLNAAIGAANAEGFPPHCKAALFRMRSWVRKEARAAQ